jgi:TonB-dependent starch-binding outer membrane protein SusC
MRITLTQVVLALSLCGITLAHPTNAQSLDSIYVTVELKNESPLKLFDEIRDQTGLQFAYQKPQIEKYHNVTLNKEKRSVRATLDLAFQNTALSYRRSGMSIVIFAREVGSQNSRDRTLQKVSGTVTDKEGLSVAGVNVIVKGTTIGTSTDANGRYEIQAAEGDVLVFSFIGYKPHEFTISNQTVINVVLQEDATTLSEVVVNGGYYTATKITGTGSIGQVSAKEITNQPVVNPMQALQGRLAGVEIVQTSGIPGTVMNIQIRGQNSLNFAANRPLYVIDGVPVTSDPFRSDGIQTIFGMDPLNTINPESIESIDVLKDADATAIYGSRGANGVVLITTKKGSKNIEGKTNLEVNFYSGVGWANQMNLLNSKQYLMMRREAFANDGLTPDMQNAKDLLLWDTTRYTNWQDVLFGGTANTTDAQLALSGGNAFTAFRVNVGYHNETLVYPGDFGYRRFSGGLSLTHTSKNNKFNATFTTHYGVDNNDLMDAELVAPAITLAPVAPELFNNDGSLNWELDSNGSPTWFNPLAGLLREQNVRSNNFISSTVLQYELFPGLSLKANLGFNRQAIDEVRITPFGSFAPRVSIRSSTSTAIIRSDVVSWITEPQILYKKEISKGFLDVVLGSTLLNKESSFLRVMGLGYGSDNLLGSLNFADNIYVFDDNASQYKYAALFGRVSYNWNEKYVVNLTGRRDGSSRFGPNDRFANFGAVGIGWIFSNESFVQTGLPVLSFGKLRASYGAAGSDNIGDYRFLDTYTGTTSSYQGVQGLIPDGLANPDYAWEVTKKLEVGTELGFIKDRIVFSASWYKNRSSNSLVGQPLPATTGYPSVTANLNATIQNTGLEFTARTINVQTKGVTWTTSINFSVPRNKLLSYPGLQASPDAIRYVVGKPTTIQQVYHYLDVNPQTGDYEVEDVNGDGLYNQQDRTTIMNTGRRFYGGLNNTVSYKGVEASFLFEFVKQTTLNSFFNSIGGDFSSFPFSVFPPVGNQHVGVLDRWQNEGDKTNVQKFTTLPSVPYQNASQSDRAYDDTSFIRLKTVSIGYTISPKALDKMSIKNLKVFVQGQNLLTFTKYIGLDPQFTGRGTLPALKMVTAGVQVGF